MNANQLPFDAEAMLAGLREWVECESPTYDPASVNRMMDIASRALIAGGITLSTGGLLWLTQLSETSNYLSVLGPLLLLVVLYARGGIDGLLAGTRRA